MIQPMSFTIRNDEFIVFKKKYMFKKKRMMKPGGITPKSWGQKTLFSGW